MTDPELVQRRLEAVLGSQGRAGTGRAGGAGGTGGGPLPGERRLRRAAREMGPPDGPDLAEGLGLWPQLLGAVGDRVPVGVRRGRWAVPLPTVVAVLVLGAALALGLAVRSSATAPGVPVPARATAAVEDVAAPGAQVPGVQVPGAQVPGAQVPGAQVPGAQVPGAQVPGAQVPGGAAPAGGATGAGETGASTPGVPVPGTVPPVPGSDGVSAAPAPEDAAAPTGEVVVHVVGQVGDPGVVTLPVGSRVADAVAGAGGAGGDADLARVNLARVLVDGEQVLVPAPGEELPAAVAPPAPAPGTAPGPGAASSPGAGSGDPATGAPLDLNTASLADLDELPGIGPVLAQRILDHRTEMGSFTSVEELGEVSGIGDVVLGRLRELVRV